MRYLTRKSFDSAVEGSNMPDLQRRQNAAEKRGCEITHWLNLSVPPKP